MQDLTDELRRADPDRYLSALYAPAGKRGDLMALYAFNAEIARIRDGTSEPGLGEIRIQWWDDVLTDNMGRTGHPVAEALQIAIRRHKLPVETFRNMLDARRFDLYSDPMPSVTDLEGYCGDTAGALIQLACLVLDPDAARHHADAAGHAGCALAMTGILSLLPRHRARQQCYLPRDLMSASGLDHDELFAAVPGKAADRAVEAMIALARDHLAEFERLAGKIPSILLPAYLPVSLVRPWLRRLSRAGPDRLQRSVQLSPLRRQLAMALRAATGWR